MKTEVKEAKEERHRGQSGGRGWEPELGQPYMLSCEFGFSNVRREGGLTNFLVKESCDAYRTVSDELAVMCRQEKLDTTGLAQA